MVGFEGSGADWLERYKTHIEDRQTVVASPHKIYGPENNDLVLQLRKRRVDRVILAGMSAALYTEANMRELLDQGFEVAVVMDGTAAPSFRRVTDMPPRWSTSVSWPRQSGPRKKLLRQRAANSVQIRCMPAIWHPSDSRPDNCIFNAGIFRDGAI